MPRLLGITGERYRGTLPVNLWRNFDAMLLTSAEEVLVEKWRLFLERGDSYPADHNRELAVAIQEVEYPAASTGCTAEGSYYNEKYRRSCRAIPLSVSKLTVSS